MKLIPGLKRVSNMIEDALEIEKESAKKAGTMGFLHRGLTLCSMPYKDLKDQFFYKRSNGICSLEIFGSPDFGLPYGSIPRLLHIYIGSEAVRTQSPRIHLGSSLSDFMKKMYLTRCGGERGDITRLNNQVRRYFRSKIILTFQNKKGLHEAHMNIIDKFFLLWDIKKPSQGSLWESFIDLNKSYYDELNDHAVPIDLRIVQQLKSSALELDIYFWLTHRMHHLHHPTIIPYELLQLQFGSEYKRLRDFKRKFFRALENVKIFWKALKVSEEKRGLKLYPSKGLIKSLHPHQDVIFK